MERKFRFMIMFLFLIGSIISGENPFRYVYQDADGDGNSEIPCTYYAWQKAHDVCGVDLPVRGNAGTWLAEARASGYSIGNVARVNSVAVYTGGTGGWGHVAFVIEVSGGLMTVEEGGRVDLDHINRGVGTFRGYASVGSDRYGLTLAGFIYINGCSGGGSSGNNPQGYFDEAVGGETTVKVRGWCFDPDDKGKSLDVHVYVGGEAGSGAPGYPIKADKSRPDVNNEYGCGNNHGFESTIEVSPRGYQTVYVYAINVGGGNNILIGAKNVKIGSGSSQRKYTIVSGDTLWGIAQKFGTTVDAICNANNIRSTDYIYPGQVLIIP